MSLWARLAFLHRDDVVQEGPALGDVRLKGRKEIHGRSSPHFVVASHSPPVPLEDLRATCIEEGSDFYAFSRIVSEGSSAFAVLDTAPARHSLLLMDATGAYHRQMLHEYEGHGLGKVTTPLMRLQDAAYTRIILVALPEVTPVSQAAALQDDLRRASIEPYAWVLNKSVLAAGTSDALLAARLAGEEKQMKPPGWPCTSQACSAARLAGEEKQMKRITGGLAKRLFVLPWLTKPPVGNAELTKLVTP